MGRRALTRRTCALVIVAAMACGCGAMTTSARTQALLVSRVSPPVPAGGTDCGVIDQISGWPTTTAPMLATFACLTGALSSGQPARLVVIRASRVASSTKTSDGYSIPAGILIPYRVLGPH